MIEFPFQILRQPSEGFFVARKSKAGKDFTDVYMDFQRIFMTAKIFHKGRQESLHSDLGCMIQPHTRFFEKLGSGHSTKSYIISGP